jgi:hypothetical protein
MGACSFPGGKRPVRVFDHPPPSSTEVKERVELYLYSPSGPSWPVLGWTLRLSFVRPPSYMRSAVDRNVVMWRMTISKRFLHDSSKVKVPRNRPEGRDGGRGIALLFLDLGTRREWVVSTTPRLLYPLERPGTHCTGGWVGPRAGLDVCEKSCPHREHNSIILKDLFNISDILWSWWQTFCTQEAWDESGVLLSAAAWAIYGLTSMRLKHSPGRKLFWFWWQRVFILLWLQELCKGTLQQPAFQHIIPYSFRPVNMESVV